jgi:hypothetical protein
MVETLQRSKPADQPSCVIERPACPFTDRVAPISGHYGSDAWRHLNGALCDNRPVRQDLLDQLVWNKILKLLEDPSLIEGEIERRLTVARNSSPNKRREESL